MREIKFRAWHIKGKGFFWWKTLLDFFAGKLIAIQEKLATPVIMSSRSKYSNLNMKGTIITWHYNSKITDIFIDLDFIVEQYTGLKDKNGKEIYEGDIVRGKEVGGKRRILIKEVKITKEGLLSPFHAVYDYDGQTWLDVFIHEIIGNVHQNKELLTKENHESS